MAGDPRASSAVARDAKEVISGYHAQSLIPLIMVAVVLSIPSWYCHWAPLQGCMDTNGVVRITGRYKELIIGAG